MTPRHLHLSAASGAQGGLGKLLLLPLLVAQFWVSEALLLPANDTSSNFVASGAPCAHGSQPWQVSLFNGLSFHCAGVLVDRSWVLTAAHCGNNKPLWARVGDDHLLLLQGEQLRRTSRPIVHPKYQQGSGPILPRRTDEHDLMLLKLGRPVVPGPRVRPLRLPFRCTQPGDQCQIAGWATTSSRRVKYNKGLSCSRVTILSPKECEVFYPGVITSNMMCAGLDQGQDPCQATEYPVTGCCHPEVRVNQGCPFWKAHLRRTASPRAPPPLRQTPDAAGPWLILTKGLPVQSASSRPPVRAPGLPPPPWDMSQPRLIMGRPQGGRQHGLP